MSQGKFKILHADDLSSIRNIVRIGLEGFIQGCSVESFGGGKDLIDRLGGDMSDVKCIITDYNMPVENGYSINGIEVIKESVFQYPKIPIILFCSQDRGVVREALEAGAYGYIEKPIMIKDLSEYVKKAINESNN